MIKEEKIKVLESVKKWVEEEKGNWSGIYLRVGSREVIKSLTDLTTYLTKEIKRLN